MNRWQQLAIGSCGVCLAIASVINSIANRWQIIRPQYALQWRPDDGTALAMSADLRNANKSLSAADAPALADVARRSLMDAPLNAAAIRQLAVAEGLAKQEPATARLLALARRISRRDFGTSWLLIDQSLSTGNLQLMMRSFDEALLTNSVAPDLLYPALSAALFDPEVRSALRVYLRNGAVWMPGFLRYAASADTEEAGLFVREAGGLPRAAAYAGISEQILSNLVRSGAFGAAARFLRETPDPAYRAVSTFGIEAKTLDPALGPFAWQFSEQPELTMRYDGNQGLSLRVEAGRGGVVLSRIFLLKPGTYRLSRRQAGSASQETRLQWRLTCLDEGHNGRSPPFITSIPAPNDQNVETFIVPVGCPAQRIDLAVESFAISGAADLAVEGIFLRAVT